MGQGATAGRRALIAHVQKCIDLANGVSGDLGVVRDANNALAQQTSKDVAELRGRLDVQKAWIERVERHAEVDRELAKDALNRVESARIEAYLRLRSMSLFDRLRWLFTGYLAPLPQENPVRATAKASDGALRAWREAARDADAAQAGMRASAGMAPRPLP